MKKHLCFLMRRLEKLRHGQFLLILTQDLVNGKRYKRMAILRKDCYIIALGEICRALPFMVAGVSP
jgi:hypothetical protein